MESVIWCWLLNAESGQWRSRSTGATAPDKITLFKVGIENTLLGTGIEDPALVVEVGMLEPDSSG
jgi:hypothetical protein